jgi:hypothetical protein
MGVKRIITEFTNLDGIVKAGDGRGFIVKGERSPLVLTAAHCLPKLPVQVSEA